MTDPRYELTLIRRQRRELELLLPPVPYLAADLTPEQQAAFGRLSLLLDRDQALAAACWLTRGGRLTGTTFTEPEPRSGDAPVAAQAAVAATWARVLRRRHPDFAWAVE
jgi:hypothetical protein